MVAPAPSRSRSPSARESGPASPTSPLRWVTIRHGPSSPARCRRCASTCWVASSAHWASSITRRPGGALAAAATACAIPSRKRASAPGPPVGGGQIGGRQLGDQPTRLRRERRSEPFERSSRRRLGGRQPEEIDERAVRDIAVVVVAACRQRRLPPSGDDLLHEARLADARLSLDHDETTRSDRGEELFDLRVAARQRVVPQHHLARRHGSHLCRRAHLPCADGLVERRRLDERRHTELLVDDPYALAVLVDGRRTIAELCVQAHQRAVGRLVERVEVQPSLGVDDGRGQLAGGRASIDEPRHRLRTSPGADARPPAPASRRTRGSRGG